MQTRTMQILVARKEFEIVETIKDNKVIELNVKSGDGKSEINKDVLNTLLSFHI